MSTSARSNQRFPNLGGPSCPWHARQHVACTPMDCEYFRTVPSLDQYGRHTESYFEAVTEAVTSEDAAVERAKTILSPVPIKKKKGKR